MYILWHKCIYTFDRYTLQWRHMSVMASQITSLMIVYSTVYSRRRFWQRKDQSSASLAFVRRIRRWPVNSPHRGPSNAENVSIWWRHHDIHISKRMQNTLTLITLLCKKVTTWTELGLQGPITTGKPHSHTIVKISSCEQKLHNLYILIPNCESLQPKDIFHY